MRYSINNW